MTPERELDPALRAIDLRVLTAHPLPRRASAGGRQAAGFEQGLRQLGLDVQPGGTHDRELVILGDAARRDVVAATEMLVPGGYVIVVQSARGAPRVLDGWLRSAGLEPVHFLRPWPALSRPQAWLPAGAVKPLRHVSAQRSGGNRARRWLGWAMDLLWRLRNHLNMAPLAGIARLTADAHAGLLDTSPWAGRSAGSEWLDWALLTGGRRSINRIVALGCDRATGQPRMVVKFPRVTESVPGMEREARALALLDRPDREPLPGVPRLLFICGEGRSIALGQSAVEGQPLVRWMRIAGYPAAARLIADWLVGLARDDGSPKVATVALLTRPIVEAFEARFGAALPAEVLAQARTAVASLSDVPRALEHRDLAPWNLRVTGAGQLGVLDWESAELNGICGPDLIYALTYLSFAKFRVRTETTMAHCYRALRDPRSPSGSVFTATLGRYASRVGLDQRSFPGIVALTWMIHARSEFARLAADVGGTPPVDRLRDSLFIKLLREELEVGTPLRPEIESNAHPVPD